MAKIETPSSEPRLKDKFLDYKEMGQEWNEFDRLGYQGTEIDKMIESGPWDEKRRKFFETISKVKKKDHHIVKDIKHKIRHLLDQELSTLKLQDLVTEQEKEALAATTKKEIKEKKSFFFKYDPHKVRNNKWIYDFNAPGNPDKHPSLALDHEHVDIQHYVDVSTLTPEKLNEIYAYYSYLVDLHIS